LIPLACFVSLVVEQSNIAIVLEDLSVMDGLRRGWEVVRSNVGTMIIMWLILTLGVSVIGGLLISLPMFLSLGPLVVSLITGAGEPAKTGLIISVICIVAYLPIFLLLSGIVRSYIETAWTLTFSRVTKRTIPDTTDQPPVSLPEPTENI